MTDDSKESKPTDYDSPTDDEKPADIEKPMNHKKRADNGKPIDNAKSNDDDKNANNARPLNDDEKPTDDKKRIDCETLTDIETPTDRDEPINDEALTDNQKPTDNDRPINYDKPINDDQNTTKPAGIETPINDNNWRSTEAGKPINEKTPTDHAKQADNTKPISDDKPTSFLVKLLGKRSGKRDPNTIKDRYSEEYAFISGHWTDIESSEESAEFTGSKIVLKERFTKLEKIFLTLGYLILMVTGCGAIGVMLWPSHLPEMETISDKVLCAITIPILFLNEFFRLVNISCIFFFANFAKDPEPMEPERGHRVAFVTTIVPKSEPIDQVMATLIEAKKIRYADMYDGTMDVWLLDEGNVPEIKELCERNGIKHFSRNGIEKYNQEDGLFRKKTKHGNHNSWRDQHDQDYDFVAVIDPDHVPREYFFERMLGYFRDPDVAFVVAPQKYGNYHENWITKAAAFQSYLFHGIVQRGANGIGCHAFLEGTNHVYRVEAFDQIGGYQDSVSEDFMTCLTLYASRNPKTGNSWHGVYTPDVVSVGEGPSSLTDFFNQQKRWSYGAWDMIFKRSWRKISNFENLQTKIFYVLLQTFYPVMAFSWLTAVGSSMLILFGNLHFQFIVWWWAPLWTTSMVGGVSYCIWMRRFYLIPEERNEYGFLGMGLLLMTIPIYVDAALSRICGMKLYFVVTAKGSLASPDGIQTFRLHIFWIVFMGGALGLNLAGYGSDLPYHRIGLIVPISFCCFPIVVHYTSKLCCLCPARSESNSSAIMNRDTTNRTQDITEQHDADESTVNISFC